MKIETDKVARIIDLVEYTIRKNYPEIEQFVPTEDEDGNVINTLLYGETYYNLENEIIELLNGVD